MAGAQAVPYAADDGMVVAGDPVRLPQLAVNLLATPPHTPAGFVHHLVKPLDPEALRQVLAEVPKGR